MSASAAPPPRIWALSDLHTDYPENRAWCDSIASSTRYRRDVLLVAGDVSDDTDILQRTLRGFVRAFGAVFFTPGNHDVWVRRAASHPHSLAKLHRLLEMCEEIGVRTRPMFVNGVSHSTHASHMSDPTFPIYHRIYLTHSFPHATPPFFSISHRHFFSHRRFFCSGAVVAPILSWWHESWDTEAEVEGWEGIPDAHACMSDYFLSRWPTPLDLRTEVNTENKRSHFSRVWRPLSLCVFPYLSIEFEKSQKKKKHKDGPRQVGPSRIV